MERELQIPNFVNDNYYNDKNKNQFNQEQRKSKTIKNLKLFGKVAMLATASVTLIGALKYANSPVSITATEIMADDNLLVTDDGRKITGKMTDQELIEYIKENNIKKEDVDKEIKTIARNQLLNKDETLERVHEDNEELFSKLK